MSRQLLSDGRPAPQASTELDKITCPGTGNRQCKTDPWKQDTQEVNTTAVVALGQQPVFQLWPGAG